MNMVSPDEVIREKDFKHLARQTHLTARIEAKSISGALANPPPPRPPGAPPKKKNPGSRGSGAEAKRRGSGRNNRGHFVRGRRGTHGKIFSVTDGRKTIIGVVEVIETHKYDKFKALVAPARTIGTFRTLQDACRAIGAVKGTPSATVESGHE